MQARSYFANICIAELRSIAGFLLGGSSQLVFKCLGSPPFSSAMEQPPLGRGPTTPILWGLTDHGPWLLTTYDSWDDPATRDPQDLGCFGWKDFFDPKRNEPKIPIWAVKALHEISHEGKDGTWFDPCDTSHKGTQVYKSSHKNPYFFWWFWSKPWKNSVDPRKKK